MISRSPIQRALYEIVGQRFRFTPQDGRVVVVQITEAEFLAIEQRAHKVRARFGNQDRYIYMSIPLDPMSAIEIEMRGMCDDEQIPGMLEHLAHDWRS